MKYIGLFVMLCTAALPLRGGITYRLRSEGPKGLTVFTVWAEGKAYRRQAEASESLSEYQRQYPIEISTDGGKTRWHLRPENKTWYEEPNGTVEGSIGIGSNARVRDPRVTMAEESSSDVLVGHPTRKFVLKISYLVESEIFSETVRVHHTRTVLLWMAGISCAPKVATQFKDLSSGVREVDEAVAVKLASVEGLIVREVDSRAERYEGGPPRVFRTTTEVIEPRCIDVDASVFAVPKGYRHQEPIMAGPGR